MIPHFTNTTAFWALLAIPLITAIHFLQHKTKTQATATLFLLEALVPEIADPCCAVFLGHKSVPDTALYRSHGA